MSVIAPVFGLLWVFFWILIVTKGIKSVNKTKNSQGSKTSVDAERMAARQEAAQRTQAQLKAELQARRLEAEARDDQYMLKQTSSSSQLRKPAKPSSGSSRNTEYSAPKGSGYGISRSTFEQKSESYKTLSAVLQEDRKHDWMARQKEEEARAYRRNFSDLGAMHEASCAADELKRSHHHDYGPDAIDSPER